GKAGAPTLLDAVWRPGATLPAERAVVRRMPASGGEDGEPGADEGPDCAIEERNDLAAARDGEAAARQEIVLDVDDHERVAGSEPKISEVCERHDFPSTKRCKGKAANERQLPREKASGGTLDYGIMF